MDCESVVYTGGLLAQTLFAREPNFQDDLVDKLNFSSGVKMFLN